MDFSEALRAQLGADASYRDASAARCEAAAPPRVVTTGRKITPNLADAALRLDLETGEPVDLFQRPYGVEVMRHMVPIQPVREGVALVDALAFSIVPPDEQSYAWVLKEMAQFLEITNLEHRRGLFGFRLSASFGDGAGVIAWGGESQKGRVNRPGF